MTTIAFLGLGAMGSRMALQLINTPHEIHIWNRDPQRMDALAAAGATAHHSAQAAVEHADIVISMLRDDSSSESVWLDDKHGALTTMKTDAIAIECSTLSVDYVRALQQRFKQHDKYLVEAPVIGSTPQAQHAELIFLTAGEQRLFEQIKPILEFMGKHVYYLEEIGHAATVKLAVNSLLAIQVAALAEIIATLDKTSVPLRGAIDIISSLPICSPVMKVTAEAMLEKKYEPKFPIHLAAKDLSYALKNLRDCDIESYLTAAAADAFLEATNSGYGKDNIHGIIQLFTT